MTSLKRKTEIRNLTEISAAIWGERSFSNQSYSQKEYRNRWFQNIGSSERMTTPCQLFFRAKWRRNPLFRVHLQGSANYHTYAPKMPHPSLPGRAPVRVSDACPLFH